MRTNRYGQPEFTCPLIDQVKETIKDFIEKNECVCTINLENCLDVLDEIREANSRLRDCSTEYIEKYEDELNTSKQLQNEIEQAENKHEQIQANMADDITQLQEQVDELNNRIQYNY